MIRASRRRGGARAAAWIAGTALALAAAGAAANEPAAGGVRLLPELERAPAALVLVLEAPSALDGEAWLAYGKVERSYRGPAVNERVRVAWEERARGRPLRFAAGDRVLLALEPLPGQSIWRKRIPSTDLRGRTFGIAEQGDAFLRSPSPGGLLLLQHYLALPPEQRERNAGVGYVIDLAEGAELPLAVAAVERLAAVPALDAQLDPSSAQRCIRALLRDDATDALRGAWLALIGGTPPLRSLRAPLAQLAARQPLAPAPVYEALGRLDGELTSELALSLLASRDSAPLRAAGARFATGAALNQLPRVLKSDPAPSVRRAAAERWLAKQGVAGIDAARPSLRDSDRDVRLAALMALAQLGPPAVPALENEIATAPPEAARVAVGALALVGGSEAIRALRELAETHPDEGVRLLARTALGQPIGHRD